MTELINVPRNTVLQGHVLDKLVELPNDCVDVVVTSTPYWGLRDYGPDCISIWGGNATCQHVWEDHEFKLHNGRGDAQKSAKFSEQEDIPDKVLSNAFCSICGAWKGQLGLEPNPQMFIDHIAEVFQQVMRVLKPSGSLWLNIGDTYFGGNGKAGRPEGWKDLENEKLSGHAPEDFIRARNKLRSNWLQPKQKMLIPARVAIALQDQGWILRNEVIWHKLNHMPESCRDRLTRSYESVYFFVKSERYFFDLNAIRKPISFETIARAKRNCLSNNKVSNNNLTAEKDKRYKEKVAKSEVGNVLGANPGDVWSLTNEGLKEEHFAAFPQKLVKQVLDCAAPKGGLVLDPFAGAGTALLVAHKMGYDWLGIELVPKYVGITNKRIERHGKFRLDTFMPQEVKVALN